MVKFSLRHKMRMLSLEYRYFKRTLTNTSLTKSYRAKYLIRAVIARRCMNKAVYGCSGGRAFLKHANCAYEDELSNYYFGCEECHEEIDAMYQEMWDEYNSGRL